MVDVVVVGSANIDLVVPVERAPLTGETLLGGVLEKHPGGKGANQAAASSRAGNAHTAFVGAVGSDADADQLLASMRAAGVDTSLTIRSNLPTGTALIWVTPSGDNTIIVTPGANSQLLLTADHRKAISEAKVVLAQLEIPLETIAAIAEAKGASTRLILNAAPSMEVPLEVLQGVDVLVVNQHEATDLTGLQDVADQASALLRQVPAVVITLGSDGALVATRGTDHQLIDAYPVTPVDTTGAGDTFCGVLAAGLAQGMTLAQAARFGSAAGALATLAPGAQESIPQADAVRRLAER